LIDQSPINYPITDYPVTRFARVCVLLRNSACCDEVRPLDRKTPRIAANGYGRRHFIERPPRRFVTARHTSKRHPFLLEVQHRVVPVNTAEPLAQPIQHPPGKPIRLHPLRNGAAGFARRKRLGIVRDHGL
jgi:hypothetical protein